MTNAQALAQQQLRRTESINTLVRLRREAREEISRLIEFLDASDEYVMTELEDDADLEEGGDSEPSLGSFDRMVNQEKSYAQSFGAFVPAFDAERDDAESGIADEDGLWEQYGKQVI
jgi:hypothetical protein